MRYVFHAVLFLCCTTALAAPLELQFVGVDGRPVGGTVVTVRSIDPARPPARPVAAEIDQVDLKFVPHVLVVPVGSTVTFPNTDKVSHQVYSFSPSKRFQLALYRGRPYPPESFDRAGVVTLGCNIHDQMRAYVYVVEAQYFGRTGADGRFAVRELEPGQYDIQVWHPRARVQQPVFEQRVTVGTSGAQLTLRAAAALKLRSESQVPANWDAY